MIEVVPPRLLRFSFYWIENGQPGPKTEISVRFVPDGEGTLMTFTQKGFADEATRDGHVQGWDECLDRLAETANASGIAAT